MTYAQVYNFYKGKRDVECNRTKELIENGFCQKGKGYIDVAKASDFTRLPSQWWHLMQYLLVKYEHHEEFNKYPYTPCGELKFWMAEVSGAFTDNELDELKNTIINSKNLNRTKKNSIIHSACWSKIKTVVDAYSII